MARMVPSPMRPTESDAERYLYVKFERELPDDVVVVHGARWVGERHGRRGEDGEADFVILDPRAGVLVLEAKSGEVGRDGPAGRWWQGRDAHEIPDPMKQAEDSKHALRALFARMPVVAGRNVHVVHGVAFPFATMPPEGFGPDVPRARVLDVNALHDLPGFVRGALASADPRRPGLPPLGDDGVARIADALAPRRRVRLHLGALAGAVEERVVELTEEQYDALDWLAQVPRGWVRGGPGTGKTLLATELAVRFAAQGLDVLLVCFNGPLAGFLGDRTAAAPNITTSTFHDLCRRRAREAGLDAEVEAAHRAPDGYDHRFPELLLVAAERLTARHDVIVVDEAQDFQAHWWVALEAWLRTGRDGRLYAFCDEAQDLHGRGGPPPAADLGMLGPFAVVRNCRNTDEVCAVLTSLAPGPEPLRPSGIASDRRPRLHWVAGLDDVAAATGRVVDTLLAHRLAPADIVVLTPRSQKTSVLGSVASLGRAPVGWRSRPTRDHVLIDTIHRFKGLEAKAVVVTELALDATTDTSRLLRVGFSRAQTVLEVVATRASHAALAPALPAFEQL